MATMYISWHKADHNARMPVEGTFISSEAVGFSSTQGQSAVAPAGAQYATVWADAAFYFRTGTGAAAKDSTSKPYPANVPVQVFGIQPGITKISAIAI